MLAFMTLVFYNTVVNQHVPGFPNTRQFITLVVFPIGMLLLNVFLAFIRGMPHWIFIALAVLQPLVAIAFVMIAAGGV
jgi:hypothetical protein